MTFRIQTKHLSITWPQADFNMEDCMSYIRNSNRNVTAIIICSEAHEDGNLHRHAYVRFNRRTDIKNPRKFDFAQKHANLQATVNVNAWINYIKQDGDFLEWNAEAAPSSDNALFDNARTMTYQQYLAWALREKIPYGYAQAAYSHTNSEAEQITFNEDPNPTLQLPLPQGLSNYEFSESLTNVIVGPSGCGKTTHALRMARKPTLFVTHMDQLKYLTPSIGSILLDDMNFSHLPLQAQIHIVDRVLPRAIHRRYGTTLIPTGTQVIMTCNERPLIWHPAIERRIKYLLIN